MSAQTFAPGTEVILSTTEEGDSVPAVVLHDDGSDTVVISLPNPHLEGKTHPVPVLRAFLSTGDAPAAAQAPTEAAAPAAAEPPATTPEPVPAPEPAPAPQPEPVSAPTPEPAPPPAPEPTPEPAPTPSTAAAPPPALSAAETAAAMSVETVVERLGLTRHPEGGWFKETWRPATRDGSRAAGTAIYFLLGAGEISRWHRIDVAEMWHYYAGEPLELRESADGKSMRRIILGPDLTHGQQPQYFVEPGVWQCAKSLGAWTLVGCTVAPAFEFSGFEMAPEGWEPTP